MICMETETKDYRQPFTCIWFPVLTPAADLLCFRVFWPTCSTRGNVLQTTSEGWMLSYLTSWNPQVMWSFSSFWAQTCFINTMTSTILQKYEATFNRTESLLGVNDARQRPNSKNKMMVKLSPPPPLSRAAEMRFSHLNMIKTRDLVHIWSYWLEYLPLIPLQLHHFSFCQKRIKAYGHICKNSV